MSPWSKFYEGRAGESYRDYAKRKYGPFLDSIINTARPLDRILELGCGPGTITGILSDDRFLHLTATDVDSDMLKVAREALPNSVGVYHHDARFGYPTHPDVVFSHGLLEHFPDEEIRQIVSAHSYARVQVHYVPSWLYVTPSFGDERLMTIPEWGAILPHAEIIQFNNGLDYALIIER